MLATSPRELVPSQHPSFPKASENSKDHGEIEGENALSLLLLLSKLRFLDSLFATTNVWQSIAHRNLVVPYGTDDVQSTQTYGYLDFHLHSPFEK